VNHTFFTYWVLKEEDFTSDDDFIQATVEPNVHSAFSPKKYFVPSQANPSNPQGVSFRDSNIWHVDDLDTELGNEEIFAAVVLGDTAAYGFYGEAVSNVLSLSP
jgi:hypothetical protein